MEENRNPEQIDEQQGQSVDEQNDVSVESMMAEIAKLKAENAKNKTALDKALHNNGELTKKLREKMTASEQEAEAKREAEEAQANRIKELENYKRRSEARERYMATIGMPADLAKEAADAEVNGDMDALAAVYKRHQEASLKAHEAEWLKNRPVPETGRDEEKAKEDPFIAGFNQGY
jgi:hypothetical protein